MMVLPFGPIPRATYRLQFGPHLTFEAAGRMSGYLAGLGISHVYASPLFTPSGPDSHGYDICDFNQLNPDLGGDQAFEEMIRQFHSTGLGLIVDFVPNHMAADAARNAWWSQTLELGPAAPRARYFDIRWRAEPGGAKPKVLLPVLEDHYARVLESGKLMLDFDGAGFCCRYLELRFPLAPVSYLELLRAMPKLGGETGEQLDLASASLDQGAVAGFQQFKRRLAGLWQNSTQFAAGVKSVLAALNGSSDKARLDAILQDQFYRLADWRVGPFELNYRRFFDITGLVALRMERAEVFAETHRLILELVGRGCVDGLRIDHPDGLWNPAEYFGRLRQESSSRGLYVVAEKILGPGEALPANWPVAGTTGYDFLNQVGGIFVNTENAAAFERIYSDFTRQTISWNAVRAEGKRRVLETDLATETLELSRRLKDLAERTRVGRDFTFEDCRRAVIGLTVALAVYRLYLTDTDVPTPAESEQLGAALRALEQSAPELPCLVTEFLRAILFKTFFPEWTGMERREAVEWIMSWQQLSGPAMAKGVEDTAFYRFNRFIALNEVGGDPGRFGGSPAEFHAANARRLAHWPHTFLATSTHDTKRGEDVRARLAVLSEMPDRWAAALARWTSLNAVHRARIEDRSVPTANDEYVLYQTLLGAWPFELETEADWNDWRGRVSRAMLKSAREAKQNTSWMEPNPAYEEALQRFLNKILDPAQSPEFIEEFKALQEQAAFFGSLNSLGQLLLKITLPGLPDFYQGAELWDFNLVDPDNRRPVDFAKRQSALEELIELERREKETGYLPRLLSKFQNGLVKMFLMRRALGFRRSHTALFSEGTYAPVPVLGRKSKHVCAFARSLEEECICVIVPRLVVELLEGRRQFPLSDLWRDTEILLPFSERNWRNVLADEPLAGHPVANGCGLFLRDALSIFPVALLVSAPRDGVETGSGFSRGHVRAVLTPGVVS